MRVKKIELIGFKSFADRTEIHLHPGVTCVVGPNGCGKSNISDALRWVFGERSAKLLRGLRMEDVIFSGTDFRKPMGIAEVSIYLDNTDHKLPLAYDEVVLTRRLDRSGQSQYFINRTACRLRDILDLILDTGMGSNSYSMIEQGKVDFIVNADSEERRFLIEEAAGISKYKVKKEEALRKLEKTEENLLRIRDILAEVQKNIQYAERQAKRAERYRLQFDEVKKLETQKAFADLAELTREKNAEESKKTAAASSLQALDRHLRELVQKEEEQKRVLQEILDRESEWTQRFYELRSESGALTQKREFNRERLSQYDRRQIEIAKEEELLTQRLASLESEIETKSQETSKFDQDYQSIERKYQEEKSAFEGREIQSKEKQTETEALKTLLFENAARLAQTQNELNRLQTLLERTRHEQHKQEETRVRLLREKETFEKRRIVHREELAALAQEGQSEGLAKETTGKRTSELNTEIARLEKEVTEKRLKIQEVSSRMKLLSELEETAEESERKLLASLSGSPLERKLIRTLRDILQIQTGYESAVEAVLGAFAQGVVAEDVETAKGLLVEMAETHAGPCGIFIQSLVRPNGKHPASARPAHSKVRHALLEVVTVRQGFEALFEPLFTNVFVVEDFSPEDLENLLPLAAELRLVTRQGILLGPQARIFFRNGRLSPHQGPFQRQGEIRTLRERSDELHREIREIEARKEELVREIQAVENTAEASEERYRDGLIRKEALDSLIQGLEERLASLEEEIRVLEFEQNEGRAEEEIARERIKELEILLQGLQQKEAELASQQKSLEKESQLLQAGREEKLQELSRLKTLLENHEERLRMSAANHKLLSTQIQGDRERITRLTTEAQENEARIQEIRREEETCEVRQKELGGRREEVERQLVEIRGRRSFQDEKHREVEKVRGESERQAQTLRDDLHRQEMAFMELTYRERTIFERMEQTYHVKLSELNAEEFLKEPVETAVLEEKIQALKERVESFGPVNLLAEEEYQELKQRHDFLAAQEKDLNEARESLLEAIRKINRTTKTLFAETFAKAQALFQEYYQILFGGGHAELILTETEESQEPGIEILVRPPGKKPQHISLLSGGEKALTGVALLFALFRIKPSPLCVLDEVDAPLDEANIDRFLNVLRTFLDSTQFLIVTHNRKTIAMADYLYGVTMEESGVSKLVSVKVASPDPEPQETKEVAAA